MLTKGVSARRATACFDNPVAESFFATVEKDLLRRRSFATRQEAKTAVFDYIETFLQPDQAPLDARHRSPVEYEIIFGQEVREAA
jgi:putative transposase